MTPLKDNDFLQVVGSASLCLLAVLAGPSGVLFAVYGVVTLDPLAVALGVWSASFAGACLFLAWYWEQALKRPPPPVMIERCAAPDCFAFAVQENFVGVTDDGVEIIEFVCPRHRAGVWSNDMETEFRDRA